MKIIEPGKQQEQIEKYWWETNEFRCKNCNCIFQIEKHDFLNPRMFFPSQEMTADQILLDCPTCKKRICITKPRRIFENNKAPFIFHEVFGKGGLFENIFGRRNK